MSNTLFSELIAIYFAVFQLTFLRNLGFFFSGIFSSKDVVDVTRKVTKLERMNASDNFTEQLSTASEQSMTSLVLVVFILFYLSYLQVNCTVVEMFHSLTFKLYTTRRFIDQIKYSKI